MSRIEVKIDHVVLRGLDPVDRHPLVNGLKSELSRILADPATGIKSARSQRTLVLRVARIPMDPGLTGASKLGGGIAKAIGDRIKR